MPNTNNLLSVGLALNTDNFDSHVKSAISKLGELKDVTLKLSLDQGNLKFIAEEIKNTIGKVNIPITVDLSNASVKGAETLGKQLASALDISKYVSVKGGVTSIVSSDETKKLESIYNSLHKNADEYSRINALANGTRTAGENTFLSTYSKDLKVFNAEYKRLFGKTQLDFLPSEFGNNIKFVNGSSSTSQIAKAEEEGNKQLQNVYTVSEEIMKNHIEAMKQLTTMMAGQVEQLKKYNNFNTTLAEVMLTAGQKSNAKSTGTQAKQEEPVVKTNQEEVAKTKSVADEYVKIYESQYDRLKVIIGATEQEIAKLFRVPTSYRDGGFNRYLEDTANRLNSLRGQMSWTENRLYELYGAGTKSANVGPLTTNQLSRDEQQKVYDSLFGPIQKKENEQANNLKTVTAELDKVIAKETELNSIPLDLRTDGVQRALAELHQYQETLNNLKGKGKISNEELSGVMGDGGKLRQYVAAINAAIQAEKNHQAEQRKAEKDSQNYEQAMTKASQSILNLATIEAKLKLNSQAFNSEQVKKYEEEIDKLRTKLENLMATGYRNNGASLLERVTSAGRNVSQLGAQVSTNVQQYNTEEAARRGGDAQNYLSKNVDKANNLLRAQANLARDLSTIFTNAFSIYGIQGFLRNLVEIGGEFEKQRIALQSILGDASKAQSMFDSIKSLAIQSPFTFKQLTADTKQLAAFQIPYNELFDTTKRLADISAGVGVDMGRLILAYGQVRSAAYLRGQELRQFTEAGVPMVDALAKKLSEVYNKTVSTKEVFEMISKKQVPFEYVKDVLFDMTNEGGVFYNMQEKLADSIAGKWSNLGDAYDIMLSDMANGNSDIIKGVIDLMKDAMSQWRTLLRVGLTSATYYVGKNLINKTQGTQSSFSSITSNALRNKQSAASDIQFAQTYRTLTSKEEELLKTRNALTVADYRKLVADKKLTDEMIRQAVATGKLTAEEAKLILTNGNLMNVQKVSKWTMALASVRNAATKAGLALKAMWSSVWPMLAISAFVELIGKIRESNQAVRETRENAKQLFADIHKNMSELGKELTIHANLDSSELENQIEKLKKSLMDNDPLAGSVISGIETTSNGDLYKELELLNQRRENLENWSNDSWQEKLAEAAGYAQRKSNSIWIDDDFKKNLQDYNDAVADFNTEFANAMIDDKELENKFKEALRQVKVPKEALDELKARFSKYVKSNGTFDMNAFVNNESTETLGQFVGQYYDIMEQIWSNDKFGTFNPFNQSINFGLRSDLSAAAENLQFAFSDAFGDMDSWLNGIFGQLKPEDFTDGIKPVFEDGKVTGSLTEMGKFHAAALIKGFKDEGLLNRGLGQWMISILGLDYKDYTSEQENAIQKFVHGALGKAFGDKSERKSDLDEYIKNGVNTFAQLSKALTDAKADLQKNLDTNNKVRLKLNLLPSLDIGKIAGLSNDDIEKAIANLPFWQKEAARQALENIRSDYNKKQDIDILSKETGDSYDKSSKSNKSGSGTKKDTFADKWKARIDAINKAVAAYDKWKKVEGADAAKERVSKDSEWGGVLKNLKTKYGISVDLEKPRKALEEAYKKILNGKSLDYLEQHFKERYQLAIQIKTAISDADYKDISDAVERQFKIFKEKWTELSNNWSIYQDVFNATGNKKLAIDLSGLNELDATDDKMQLLLDDFSLVTHYNFEDVKNMSPEDYSKLDDQVKKYYENRKNEIESLKQTNKKAVADIFKRWKTTENEISIIERNRQKDIWQIQNDKSLKPGAKRNAINRINKDADYQKFLLSDDYYELVNNTLNESLDKANKTLDDYKIKLTAAYSRGYKSQEEYISGLKTIIELQEKIKNGNSAFSIAANNGNAFNLSFKDIVDNIYEKAEQEYLAASKASKGKITTRLTNAEKSFTEAKQYKDTYNTYSNAKNGLNLFTDSLSFASDTLEKFGVDADGLDDVLSTFKSGLNGMQIGEQVGTNVGSMMGEDLGKYGGIWGAFAGLIVGMVSEMVSSRDKQIAQDNQELSRSINLLSNTLDSLNDYMESSLGGLYTNNYNGKTFRNNTISSIQDTYSKILGQDLIQGLAYVYKNDTGNAINSKYNDYKSYFSNHTIDSFKEYIKPQYLFDDISNGHSYIADILMGDIDNLSNYQLGYASLIAQRTALQQQYYNESDKKSPDDTTLDDLQNQIDELGESIDEYAKNMANSLYGIDFESYSEKIANSLVDAWASGSDAAEAYADTVTDVLKDVAASVIQQKYIENQLKPLEDEFLAQFEKDNGVITDDSFAILEKMYDTADEAVEATNTMMDGLEQVANEHGQSLYDSDNAGSLSSSIAGVTEETADLLASYLNAIRMDVSIERTLMESTLGDGEGSVKNIAQAQLTSMREIQGNVSAIKDNTDSMISYFDDLVSTMNAVTLGTKQLHMA